MPVGGRPALGAKLEIRPIAPSLGRLPETVGKCRRGAGAWMKFYMGIGISDKMYFMYQYFLFDISIFTIVFGRVSILPATRFSMIHDFGFT
jgi:hypothetical protein